MGRIVQSENCAGHKAWKSDVTHSHVADDAAGGAWKAVVHNTCSNVVDGVVGSSHARAVSSPLVLSVANVTLVPCMFQMDDGDDEEAERKFFPEEVQSVHIGVLSILFSVDCIFR